MSVRQSLHRKGINRTGEKNKKEKERQPWNLSRLGWNILTVCVRSQRMQSASSGGLGLDQWQKGYPSREVWIQDAKDGCTYLAVEEG